MNRFRISTSTLTAIAFPALLVAQQVPQLEVDRPGAVTSDRFIRISEVQQLGNGGIVVNDPGRRQLVLLDQNLQNRRVLLDSSSVNMGYGKFEGTLFRTQGDSLMLMNRYGMAALATRTGFIKWWAPARSRPMVTLNNGHTVGVDPDGNFVFSGNVNQRPTPGPDGTTPKPTFGFGTDSGVIVRVNFTTSAVSQVARYFRQPGGVFSTEKADDGRMIARSTMNILPLADEFVMLSNGSVAVLRASDYHVDIFDKDGKMVSAPKLPFPFVALSVADRQALIDSARAEQAAADAAGRTTIAREGAGVVTGVDVARATGLNGKAGGFSVDVKRTGDTTAGTVSAKPNAAVQASVPFAIRTADIQYVAAEKLPANYPAFIGGRALMVDFADNLWIRTTAKDPSMQGAVQYDVVDHSGKLVQRVRIPAGRTISGFGPNGELYLTFKDDAGMGIERTTLKK